MNTTINRQQWQEEEALRRFQLISPLLQTGLDDAKRIQLRKKIAEENNISVRSLYRYEKAFSERQFTGLKPADREKHRSQKLPENFSFLLEQAIQLRKEVPERSVAQIIYILETEGLCTGRWYGGKYHGQQTWNHVCDRKWSRNSDPHRT